MDSTQRSALTLSRIMRLEPVALGRGSVLGPHTVVLPGSTVGEATTIHAGSLVMASEHIPPGTHWQGAPTSSHTHIPARRNSTPPSHRAVT